MLLGSFQLFSIVNLAHDSHVNVAQLTLEEEGEQRSTGYRLHINNGKLQHQV